MDWLSELPKIAVIMALVPAVAWLFHAIIRAVVKHRQLKAESVVLSSADNMVRHMADSIVYNCIHRFVAYGGEAVSECLDRLASMNLVDFKKRIKSYTGLSVSDSTAIEVMKMYQSTIGKCIKRFDSEDKLLSELRRVAIEAINECNKMLRLTIMKPLAEIVGQELSLGLHLSKVLENLYCSDLKPNEVKKHIQELIDAAKQVITTCKMLQS